MKYTFTHFSEKLVYISYDSPPAGSDGERFVADFLQILDEASQPLYTLVDSRSGPVTEIRMLKKLSTLTEHRNAAFTLIFGFNEITSAFAMVFLKLTRKTNVGFFATAEDAIARLKSLSPDVLEGIEDKLNETLSNEVSVSG